MITLIPYRLFEIGGPISFLAYFRRALKDSSHTVKFGFTLTFDNLFIIFDCSLLIVLYAKLRHKKIIQRIDGVYYPALLGKNGYIYWLKNLKARIIHTWLADEVVYQSRFSEESSRLFLGSSKSNTRIIYNGATIPQLQAKQQPSVDAPCRLLAYANWRRRDQLLPILEAVKLLDPQQYNLDIFGPMTQPLKKIIQNWPKPTHINFLSKLPHHQLLNKISRHDIFLFADQSACPNSVIEALSHALPVVAYDRGAAKELIESGRSGQIISLKVHTWWQKPYHFGYTDYQSFAQAIKQVRQNLASYQSGAYQRAKAHYDIKDIMQTYLKILTL